MKFADFVNTEAIRASLSADDKPGAIRELTLALQAAGRIKESEVDGIVKAVMKREELGSTGIGRGVAVPHTKHPSVDRLVGTVDDPRHSSGQRLRHHIRADPGCPPGGQRTPARRSPQGGCRRPARTARHDDPPSRTKQHRLPGRNSRSSQGAPLPSPRLSQSSGRQG